jgi:hypothetical protein
MTAATKQTFADHDSGQISAQEVDRLLVPAPELERECRSFTHYLSGKAPSRYIIEKYQDFHQKIGLPPERDRFGRFLILVSAQGPCWVCLADSYASLWRRNSAVRKKLIVTLALLETAPPTFEMLDRVPPGGRAGAVLRLAAAAMKYAFVLLIATALFTPVRVFMMVRDR